MKVRYLEFKDLIDRIYTREIKNIEEGLNPPHPGGEGIDHEWIEYAGPGYEMVIFDIWSNPKRGEEIWDEDFLKDYRIEGDRMIRIN